MNRVGRCAIAAAAVAGGVVAQANSRGLVPTSSSIHFEENLGQAEPEVNFLAHGRNQILYLTGREAVLATKESRVRMTLVGGEARSPIVGKGKLAGRTNYLVGSDPSCWRTNLPHFERVEYSQVYPGRAG